MATKKMFFKGWTHKFQEEILKAKDRLDELTDNQIDIAIGQHQAPRVKLNENTVIYMRRNKHMLSIRQLAAKFRATPGQVYKAVHGETWKYLNEDYPPWPSIEETKNDPDAWTAHDRKHHPWRQQRYKTMPSGWRKK
jgi:hypothetical protein